MHTGGKVRNCLPMDVTMLLVLLRISKLDYVTKSEMSFLEI